MEQYKHVHSFLAGPFFKQQTDCPTDNEKNVSSWLSVCLIFTQKQCEC